MTQIHDGARSFDDTPRPENVEYFFDRSNEELHELAMESRSFMFLDHVYRIILGRYTEDTIEDTLPLLDDIARRKNTLRNWNISGAKSMAQRSVAERLSAPPAPLNHKNHEVLPPHLQKKNTAAMGMLSHLYYEQSP